MLRPVLLALLLSGTATLAQAKPETVPLLREIKEWVIGCDNLRNCHALSAPSGVDEEDYSSLTLHIWHQAGAEGYLRLRFDHRGEALDLATLRLDGQPLGLELTRDLHVELDDQGGDPEVRSYGVIEEAAARRWLQALRDGKRLELPDDKDAHVSLSGLSASLLLIDAVQGRVDNLTALARQGKGAASAVPARLPTPVLRKFPGAPALTAQEQAGLVAAALRPITPEVNGTGGEPEASAGALTAQQAMTVVRYDCAAYNCEYDVVSRQRQAPYAETTLQLESLPLEDAALQGSVGYDPATGTLSYFYKQRGIGDCGGGGCGCLTARASSSANSK
ncbi:DUF1176 domain-containing protein [Pseudomonas sp. H2_E05]